MDNHFRKVWTIPILLALVTIFGLLASLLGTGIWYVLSWAALSLPLAIIVRKISDFW